MPDSYRQKLMIVEGLKSTVVDDILLWVFLFDKLFILIDSCLKKFLTSCTIHPAKCNEMTMIKNFNQAKYFNMVCS